MIDEVTGLHYPENNKTMETKTADEIIQLITEALIQADAKFIEQIANQVLTEKVKYIGGATEDTFEIS